MMAIGLSRLIDPSRPIVLDTSVVINLAHTGIVDAIVAAMPNRIVVVDVIVDDLSRRNQEEQHALSVVEDLVQRRLVDIAQAADFTEGYFESLVAGDGPDTLDDGEAATITYALERNAIPILDERKALRICSERFPSLQVGGTTDILSHPSVEQAVGRSALEQAVLRALDVHMRVIPVHLDWVVELIGSERTSNIASIPASARAAIRERKPKS